MTHRPTVAVVGAGFSGLLTALRLLEDPDGPCVRLIERRGRFAKGAAYSTLDDDHLLNVRAANMSAFPEDMDHFVRWLATIEPSAAKTGFVRRSLYGAYLQTMIQRAVENAPAGRLVLEADAAVAITRAASGWRIELEMGRSFAADAVILAIGNLPPQAPKAFDPAVVASPAYVVDPWSLDRIEPPKEGLAVLVGTGLTMVDVALHLSRRRPGLNLLALSRRGLLPRRHLEEGPAPRLLDVAPQGGPRALLRHVRQESGDGDWRPVLDGLRPHVHHIWRTWRFEERRRFLRHVRPWWDVHRHRLAPAVAAKLDHLLGSGVLKVEAARLLSAHLHGEDVEIKSRRRRGELVDVRHAALVVNCSGPAADAVEAAEPLLSAALANGLFRKDPHGLGLEVDSDWRLLDGEGRAHKTLFAVGPITRGSVFEITSVPDIRWQARDCAYTAARALERGRRTHQVT
jgi:uncharacterized NAD(P)/FAD-binding protein YdhS